MKNSKPASKAALRAQILHNIPLYLMFLPGAIYLLVNNYIPMGGLIIAFKQVNWNKGILKSPWVGFSNFEYLFKTNDAWNITRNTLGYNVVFIVLGTVLAIAIAILLNEIRSKTLKKTYQTVILLPYLISMVVVSYLVFAMLSSENGFINLSILRPLGLSEISWYTEPKYWPAILIITNTWKGIGYGCLIYISSINGIEASYYEAAELDGANGWQRFLHITLPMLKPTSIMILTTTFISAFNLMIQPMIMTQGGPENATMTPIYYIYRTGFTDRQLGYASAMSVIYGIIIIIFTIIQRKITNAGGDENA